MTQEERKRIKQQKEEEKLAKMDPEIRVAYLNQKRREKIIAAITIPLFIVVIVVVAVVYSLNLV